jgi:hypothetical protein
MMGGMAAVGAVCADTGPWAFTRPDGTQHWYSVKQVPHGITWINARNAAINSGGYLATLTTTQENDFVFDLCDDPAYWNLRMTGGGRWVGPWLGGVQAIGGSEPDGGWEWISGEPMVFTNWAPGQPDNFIPNENCMYFGEQTGSYLNAWSDTRGADTNVHAFVIEYDASPRTVGLTRLESNVTPGYVLFAPIPSTNTYLVDNQGLCVHQWPSSNYPGQSVYLVPTGILVRTAVHSNSVFSGGGEGGRVEKIDWDGNLVWAFDYSTAAARQHHDIEILPNGNILMIAWEYRSGTDAINAGRMPGSMSDGELWPDHIIEVAPTGSYGGDIVWEWHVWDHLIQDYDAGKPNYGVVSNHPERININYFSGRNADWNHCNGIDYNPYLDQIIISSREFSEVWVIDHSTTPAEAAGSTGGNCGMGGDLLYRWGNPAAYNAGTTNDQRLFVQHNPQWIATNCPGAGHILVFNNGTGRPEENYTTIDEWEPPLSISGCYTQQPDGSWGPTGACWTYQATPRNSFYSHHISGAQRLANGNTLICDGEGGRLFEVTCDGDEVWSYESPVAQSGSAVMQGTAISFNRVFRAERYPTNKNYFTGLAFDPGAPVEQYARDCDYDGDEIEDAWECLHDLNPAMAADALEDPDADGFSSLEEYIADTDPRDSNAFFRVTAISNSESCIVFFQASGNRVYAMEYCDDPATGRWAEVEGQSQHPGAGGPDSLVDTNPAAMRAYRLSVSF